MGINVKYCACTQVFIAKALCEMCLRKNVQIFSHLDLKIHQVAKINTFLVYILQVS